MNNEFKWQGSLLSFAERIVEFTQGRKLIVGRELEKQLERDIKKDKERRKNEQEERKAKEKERKK